MAGTTWNPADKSVNVTLSGTNNLTAHSTGSNGGVRTIDKHSAGKYYWEQTLTIWANNQTGVGVSNATPAVTAIASAWASSCGIQKSGAIFFNGGAAPGSPTLGARAVNDIIGLAIDLTAQLMWFRVAPSGNWNGSGTANPATATGGVSVGAIVSTGLYPVFAFVAGGDTAVANFGDTAFSGAVPAGFTIGFPSGADVVAGGAQASVMVLA